MRKALVTGAFRASVITARPNWSNEWSKLLGQCPGTAPDGWPPADPSKPNWLDTASIPEDLPEVSGLVLQDPLRVCRFDRRVG